jgi:hypothetical protein
MTPVRGSQVRLSPREKSKFDKSDCGGGGWGQIVSGKKAEVKNLMTLSLESFVFFDFSVID